MGKRKKKTRIEFNYIKIKNYNQTRKKQKETLLETICRKKKCRGCGCGGCGCGGCGGKLNNMKKRKTRVEKTYIKTKKKRN